jgi:O-antigen/teichoic acid export membrane protein
MAVVTNRMCLALFMPAAIFLVIYGTPLLTVWAGPVVAHGSGALMPVLVVPFLFAIAGQFNSGAVLIGQGKHGAYARSFVVEVVCSIVGLFVFIPRYGAFGAACVVAVALMVNRCIYLAILMCRVNGLSIREYLDAIYTRPLLSAVPCVVLAMTLRVVLPGRTWFELIAAASLIAVLYFAVAFFVVLDPESRQQLLRRIPGAARLRSQSAP